MTGQPELVAHLFPPAFRLKPSQSRDQFFAAAASLKTSIDATKDDD